MTTTLRVRNAMLAELGNGDTTLDAITAMHDTLARAERDHIAAWYRAGLGAGGQPIDWVNWYTQPRRRPITRGRPKRSRTPRQIRSPPAVLAMNT
jgi:hypothetical protein